MQKNKFRNCLQILPVLFFMAFVSASCIKDDLSGCPSPHVSGVTLQVKAFDADGNPLDGGTIKDITLYVFNADKTLLDILHVSLSELVTLDYPGHDNLKLVAWGNGRQGGQTLPALRQGDHLETAFVSLIQPQTRITYPVAGSPDDLFYGTIDIQTSADALSAGDLAPPQGVRGKLRRRFPLHPAQDGQHARLLRPAQRHRCELPPRSLVQRPGRFRLLHLQHPAHRRGAPHRHLPPGCAPDHHHLRQQRQTPARGGRPPAQRACRLRRGNQRRDQSHRLGQGGDMERVLTLSAEQE